MGRKLKRRSQKKPVWEKTVLIGGKGYSGRRGTLKTHALGECKARKGSAVETKENKVTYRTTTSQNERWQSDGRGPIAVAAE